MFYAISHTIIKKRAARILFVMIGLSLICLSESMAETVSDSLKVMQNSFRRKAQRSNLQMNVYDAIYYYEKFFDVGGNDKKAAYKLANLYFLTRDYSQARVYYDSVTIEKTKKFALAYYRKGIVCMSLEEYQEAIESFEIFRKQYRGRRDPDQLRRQARTMIDKANWAIIHSDSIANISISNIETSVNKPHIEFSPFPVSESRLIYGSFVQDTLSSKRNYRQLYLAEKEDSLWRSKGTLSGPFNDPDFHTGNAALSVDGNRMYFTRCRKNWRDKRICEIFVSELIDGIWQDPTKLPYPINDENYTSTQPALGQYLRTGADILYFVSDRPGSRGGLDIWYTVFDTRTGVFKEPRNAGSKINTRGNECCPFYNGSNRTLYFSSTNKNGFGGYDIFKCTGSARNWTEALPLPKPINSPYDDTYFSIIPGSQEGFFTSNRPGSYSMENGSCCDDIFYYRYNECTRVDLKGKVINSTNYDIYDELNSKYKLDLSYPKDKAPVADIPVQLYLIESEIKEEILIAQVTTDIEGEYNFDLDLGKEYKIVVKNYGFFDRVTSLSTEDVNCTETLDAGVTAINVLPPIRVRFNVYYEHDKSRLTKEAMTTIDTLLIPVFDLFPNAIIEIGSHTDSTGSDSYNERLSLRRSESVVKYLIEEGVSEDRLVAHGYGESMPIAPNTNPDGTDNPEGRQLNRRTELRIIGEISTFYLDE